MFVYDVTTDFSCSSCKADDVRTPRLLPPATVVVVDEAAVPSHHQPLRPLVVIGSVVGDAGVPGRRLPVHDPLAVAIDEGEIGVMIEGRGPPVLRLNDNRRATGIDRGVGVAIGMFSGVTSQLAFTNFVIKMLAP